MAAISKIYDTYAEARTATDAVNNLALPGVEASLVGNDHLRDAHDTYMTADPELASGTATGAGVGAALGGGAGLLAGLGMLAIPGIGPVVAAGWLAATALGAVGGAAAGGAVGALTDMGISDEDAPVYSEAVRRGGIVVSARFPENNRYEVERALNQPGSFSVADRRRTYEKDGWVSETGQQNTLQSRVPPLM